MAATLTLFCGLPGAGKTTLARRLESEGRGVRLCTDEWQAALGVAHHEVDVHDRLQRQLYRHALGLLSAGVDVILEDGLWTAAERAEKLADARRVGAVVELHVFPLPVEVLWRRLEQRNASGRLDAFPMTRLALERAAEIFQTPTPTELAAFDRYELHVA